MQKAASRRARKSRSDDRLHHSHNGTSSTNGSAFSRLSTKSAPENPAITPANTPPPRSSSAKAKSHALTKKASTAAFWITPS